MRLSGLPVCDCCAVFEGTGGGGSGGDDAIALCQCGVYRFGGAWRKSVVLGVEADFVEVFGTNGLEGAEAHVECKYLDLNAFCLSSAMISGVKWRPAVGAAAEPGCWGRRFDSGRGRRRCRRGECREGAACGLFC